MDSVFQDIKVGDKVLFKGPHAGEKWRVETVTRRTPKRFFVHLAQFTLDGGLSLGDTFYRSAVRPYSEDALAEQAAFEAETEAKKAARLRVDNAIRAARRKYEGLYATSESINRLAELLEAL